jgi:RNA polymerase sigma-70 factor (ECF subfamily)
VAEPSREGPGGLVDHYFRHSYGRLVSTLARRFGAEPIATIEDAAQEALLLALTSWALRGVPDDPGAWLYRVAYNNLLDRVRRSSAWRRALEHGAGEGPIEGTVSEGYLANEIGDDQLRMLFVCCDPELPAASQLVLALKILCGFSVSEIALRLFTSEGNVYKRLERGREQLARKRALDAPDDLGERLPAVHAVLYLLFNEGYGAARDDELVRRELCDEALRLVHLLVSHPGTDTPTTRALVALLHLHAARLPTRIDATGELLTLAEQDRSLWSAEHVRLGIAWLEASAEGPTFSRYHAEAAIAAEHVLAPSYAETRWLEIAELYSMLDRLVPSPLNHLNRAVAIAEAHGAQAGLAVLDGVRLPPGIAGYYLWDAVVGDLHRRVGNRAAARSCLQRALANAPTEAERTLLARRLAACSLQG